MIPKKKTTAEPKHTSPHEKKQKTSAVSRFLWIRQHWMESVFSLVGIVVLCLFIFLVYQKLMEEKSIARYLPEKTTVAFLAFNTDRTSDAYQWIDQMSMTTFSGSLISKMTGMTDDQYMLDIDPLLAKKAGVALVQKEDKQVSFLVFLALQEKEKFLMYVQNTWNDGISLPFESYQNNQIYSLQKPYAGYLGIIDSYAVFSPDKVSLQSVFDVFHGRADSLSRSDKWIQIQKNLPYTPFAFFYADYAKGINLLKTTASFRKAYRDIFTILKPLEENTYSIGGVLDWQEKEGEKGLLSKWILFGKKEFYGALVGDSSSSSLHNQTDANTIGFLGGNSIFSRVKTILEQWGRVSPDAEIVLESLIHSYLKKYVATQITLSDILDLSQGESGIFFNMNPQTNETEVLGVFHIIDENVITDRMTEIFSDFAMNSEFLYTPKIRDLVLPDGTVGKEIYLDPKDITEKQDGFDGGTVHYLSIANDTLSPGYMIKNDILYVFSHYDLLKEYLTAPTFSPLKSLTHAISFEGDFRFFMRLLQTSGAVASQGNLWEDFLKKMKGIASSLKFTDTGVMYEQFVGLR